MSDIFTNNKYTNKMDVFFLAYFYIMSILFLVGYLINPSLTSFGLIYILLILYIIFLITYFGAKKKSGVVPYLIFGKDKNVKRIVTDILLGISIVILVFVLLPDIFHSLSISILTPFSISSTSSTTNNTLIAIVLIFFGVEVEEMFLNSTFIPIVTSFNSFNKGNLGGIIEILAIIVIFFGAFIISTEAIYLGLFLMIISFVIYYLFIKKRLNRYVPKASPHIYAIVLGVILITILHVYSYNITSSDLITASIPLLLFFTLEAIINWYRQSAITSRAMHSTINAIAVIGLGLVSFYIAILIIGFYMLMIIGAYVVSKSFKGSSVYKYGD